MRIVSRIEISFDITKDFVPDSEATRISQVIERAKTLNDQVEHNLKATDLAVPFSSLSFSLIFIPLTVFILLFCAEQGGIQGLERCSESPPL